MKKFRILTPMMATIAAVAPTASVMAGCSRINYTEITETLKETMITEFIDLCKIPRMTWMGYEAYNYIQTRMEAFGFAVPTGTDKWSAAPEPAAEIKKTKETYEKELNLTKHKSHDYWGEYTTPTYGNMWYDIPATKGFEDRPMIMLQSHYDMNMTWKADGSKTDPCDFDSFKTWADKGVQAYYDKDKEKIFVKDETTSLGADNGVGVAEMLAIAKHHKAFKHGPIRLMFSADESGATSKTDPSTPVDGWYSGLHYLLHDQQDPTITNKPLNDVKYIISFDGNTKGVVYNSIAGLHECAISGTLEPSTISKQGKHKYTLIVQGLSGGHSAYDINLGHANALHILAHCMASDPSGYQYVDVSCNSGAYQICSKASAVFYSGWKKEDLETNFNKIKDSYTSLYCDETGLDISLKEETVVDEETGLSAEQSSHLTTLCNLLNYGPNQWYDNPEHTNVKTSCNFGPLNISKTLEGKFSLDFHSVIRSADKQTLETFTNIVHSNINSMLTQTLFPNVVVTDTKDPAWEVDNNKLVELVVDAYNTLRIKNSQKSSHAWLEIASLPEVYSACGFEQPSMVCFGPDIFHSHEVNEYTYTDSFDAVIKGTLYSLEFSDKLK